MAPNRGMGIRTEPYKLTLHYEVTAILILYGLPRLLTGSIVAHEMMHAWLQIKVFGILAVGKIPGKLLVSRLELTYLSIRINFNDLNENLAALCILRSSPNLRELEILGRTKQHTVLGTVPNIWEEHYYNCPFNHLWRLKILDMCGVRRELDFINFVLANSPVIESTTFQPASDDV